MPSIYLAGPITGLDFDGSTGWREQFKTMVDPSIQCFSPMRAKEYLKNSGVILDTYEDTVLSTARAINTRDHFDCSRVDVVVANMLGAERVSIGTVMEIAWAYAYRKPVVLIMEPNGNLHDHGMIRECVGFRVTNLEQAAHTVNAILMP